MTQVTRVTYLIPLTDVQSGPQKVPLQHALHQVPPDAKGAVVNANDFAAKLGVEIVEDELETRCRGGYPVDTVC